MADAVSASLRERSGDHGGLEPATGVADGHRTRFFLVPGLQGTGIGTAVLRALLDRCDRDGLLVRLNVLRGSPARRLYERVVFRLETEDTVDVFMVREPGGG